MMKCDLLTSMKECISPSC